jgi:outer membrane protein TolC
MVARYVAESAKKFGSMGKGERSILRLLAVPAVCVVLAAAASAQEKGGLQTGRGHGFFSRILGTYSQRPVGEAQGKNPADLGKQIRDGKLRLSLVQLKAAVRENNLAIASASYDTLFAQTDMLRAKSGGAPRGAPGVQIPSGLFAGAIGTGVGSTGGLGGSGSAGGISGGGHSVSVTPRGTFDPTLLMNLSIDRTSSPLNTVRVSGVPTVTTSTTALQTRFTQAFTFGTSVSVTYNNQRQSSTQQFLLFNPSFVSAFTFSFTQQLLNGYGRTVNRRFIEVAKNEQAITQESYRQQVASTLAQALNSYWDLAAARDNVRLAEKSLAVARQLYNDNKVREELGKISYLDVVTAASEMAARQRDLVIAQTNQQLLEVDLKNAMSREIDPVMGAAGIETVDPLPSPAESDVPKYSEALATAIANRPELRQAEGNILNQSAAIKYARNLLLPTLTLFGVYTGSGLWGDRVIDDPAGGPPIVLPGGISQAFRQVWRFNFPDYAFGLSLSIPLMNRSAQADNVRTRLEQKQAETDLQGTRTQIAVEVRKALIGLVQAKAQVEAAGKAAELSGQILTAEEEKLLSGVSTPYDVILRQRDLISAQSAEVQARVNYAKAVVEMRRSMGILDQE